MSLSKVKAELCRVQKKSDDAVPLRWQDPVAVASRKYTAASDVFSFGVSDWTSSHMLLPLLGVLLSSFHPHLLATHL